MTSKPNIVYLLSDQIRAGSLPVYGETQIETPHIDRLAQEGTVFSNAIATAPVCTPYRAMLLTGRHPQTTGHLINFVRTRHDEIGLGDVFSRNGYRNSVRLVSGIFTQVHSQKSVDATTSPKVVTDSDSNTGAVTTSTQTISTGL